MITYLVVGYFAAEVSLPYMALEIEIEDGKAFHEISTGYFKTRRRAREYLKKQKKWREKRSKS